MTNGTAPRLADYLGHIVEAIRRIDRYTANLSEAAFFEDQMAQDAVIRNFEVIGEAARNIDRHYPDYRASHPEVPWTAAYEMRNALAHGYFKVDLSIVWRTIQTDLAAMRQTIQGLLRSTNADGALD